MVSHSSCACRPSSATRIRNTSRRFSSPTPTPAAIGKTRGTTGSAAAEPNSAALKHRHHCRSFFYSLTKEYSMIKITPALLCLGLLLAGGNAVASDTMNKDSMAKDPMKKETMKKDSMQKNTMKKDGMKKDG